MGDRSIDQVNPNTVYVFDDLDFDMHLKRDYDFKRCNSFELFPVIKYLMSHKKERFRERYNRMIMEFEDKLISDGSNLSLDYFHDNLETLNVSYYNFWFYNRMSDSNVLGSYSLLENEIYIDKKGSLRILAHELLHVLGSKIDGPEYKSGFHYANAKDRIHLGKYFNEGYVEVLADRYFGMRSTPAYAKDKVFATLIEDVVGREKMEELYSHGDIEGLFDELLPYTTEDKLVNFFKDVEKNHKLKSDKDGYTTKEQLQAFARCENFCLECWLQKQKHEGLSDTEIGKKYFSYLDRVYEKTAQAYNNSLYLEVLTRVVKISYANVVGEEKSNYKL